MGAAKKVNPMNVVKGFGIGGLLGGGVGSLIGGGIGAMKKPQEQGDPFQAQLDEARALDSELQGADIPDSERKALLAELNKNTSVKFNAAGFGPSLDRQFRFDLDALGSIQDRLKKLKENSVRAEGIRTKVVEAQADQPGQRQTLLSPNRSSLLGSR